MGISSLLDYFFFFTNTPENLSIAFIVCTIIALIVNSIPNRKLLGYNITDQILDLLPNLMTASIMCLSVYFIGRININTTLLLFIQVFSGVGIYIFLNILIKNSSLIYLWNFMKSLWRKHDKKISKSSN